MANPPTSILCLFRFFPFMVLKIFGNENVFSECPGDALGFVLISGLWNSNVIVDDGCVWGGQNVTCIVFKNSVENLIN